MSYTFIKGTKIQVFTVNEIVVNLWKQMFTFLNCYVLFASVFPFKTQVVQQVHFIGSSMRYKIQLYCSGSLMLIMVQSYGSNSAGMETADGLGFSLTTILSDRGRGDHEHAQRSGEKKLPVVQNRGWCTREISGNPAGVIVTVEDDTVI